MRINKKYTCDNIEYVPPRFRFPRHQCAAERRHSGVVDADVDTTEVGLDIVEHGENLNLLGQVTLDRIQAAFGA